MMKKTHNIDNVFREALYDFDMKPPKFIWDDIKIGLENRRKEKRLMLYRSMAAAVALLISFLSGYYLTNLNSNSNDIVADNSEQVSNSIVQNFSIIEEPINITPNKSTNDQSNNIFIQGTSDIFSTDEVEISNKISNPIILSDKEDEFKVENIQYLSNSDFNYIELALHEANIITVKNVIDKNFNQLFINDFVYTGSEKVINGFKDDLQKKGNNKWALTGNFSPTYTINESAYSENNSTNNELLLQVEKSPSTEKTLLAYNGGLKVSYQLHKRFSIEGGVYYSKQGKQINNVRINVNELAFYDGGNLIETNSYTTPSNSGEIRYNSKNDDNLSEKPITGGLKQTVFTDTKLQQNFEYIEIPVYLKYKLIDRKIDIQMHGSFAPGFLITNKVFINTDDDKKWIGYTEGVSKINYQASLGFGIDYPLSKKIVFNLEPTVKYSLNSLSLGNDIKPISIGVFTGVSYFFN